METSRRVTVSNYLQDATPFLKEPDMNADAASLIEAQINA